MASRQKMSCWQAPPFTAPASERMGWLEEQLEEGEGWLAGQKTYKEFEKNKRIFDAIFSDKTKSTLITNELKYDIRKFVETLAEMREIGTFGSDAPQFKAYADMQNKLIKNVYIESFFPIQIRKVLQYASVFGRGYLWPKCKTANYGYGERQIIFEDMGLLDVVPVQVPKSNDVQDAYTVTAFEYMPVAEAHGRFPRFQADLQPVERMKFRGPTNVPMRRVDYAERFRNGDEARNFGSLNCEIRYTFIRDLSINTYGKVLPMGEPGTSWFYEIPYVGMDILAGIRNGQPYMRKARAEDCLIYPTKRLMISNRGMTQPMYDGPAFDWHGEIPPVQYDVDDWPWEPLGRSLVGDVGAIEITTRKIERKVDQVITTSLNPPMGYDRSATGGPKIENFDIFEENVRAGVDGKPQDILQSLLPDSVKADNVHFKFLEYLAAKKGKQLGLEDLANLAQLKMNIASDTADKILEGVGPVAKGIAGNVEKSNAKVARQLGFMIPQWYDVARVVSIVGPGNVVPEIFDFDPSSLIPSHLPEEYIPDAGGLMSPPLKVSAYPQLERARRYAKNVRVTSVPSTQLKITQMQEQLLWLQLWRGQAPISFSTVAKKLNIDNYGEVKGTTEREKWFNEKLEDMALQAKAAQMAQALGIAPQEPGGGKKKPQGRPPSGHAAPKLRQKAGGRTTVTESK